MINNGNGSLLLCDSAMMISLALQLLAVVASEHRPGNVLKKRFRKGTSGKSTGEKGRKDRNSGTKKTGALARPNQQKVGTAEKPIDSTSRAVPRELILRKGESQQLPAKQL